MDSKHQDIARQCLEGAESGTMTFQEIVGTLTAGAFDGYLVDLRLGKATYYLQDGRGLDLPTQLSSVAVATQFNVDVVKTAIREAQTLVPGYTYKGFCDKVKRAGCTGYLVSFLGRRVLYFGRTGETHTEYFPGNQPAHRFTQPCKNKEAPWSTHSHSIVSGICKHLKEIAFLSVPHRIYRQIDRQKIPLEGDRWR